MKINLLVVTVTLTAAMALTALAPYAALAQNNANDLGIRPDSPFYFVQRATEWVKLKAISDPKSKVEYQLQLLNRRIAEIKYLAERGKITMEKAVELQQRLEMLIDATRQNVDRAIEIGQDVNVLLEKMKALLERQQNVLEDVKSRIPPQAQDAIQKAIEVSRQGKERASEVIKRLIPTPQPQPSPTITWEECIKIPGAKILMSYPAVCVTPDNQRATQPIETPAPGAPRILNIDPSSGHIGTRVTITGSGFTPTRNSVRFGEGIIYLNNLESRDGRTISFEIPDIFDSCNPDGTVCWGAAIRVFPGTTYIVTVINANGASNGIPFKVTGKDQPTPSPRPTVSPTPRPTPTPTPNIVGITVEADDYGLYPETITIPRGKTVSLTLKVRSTRVYYGGLEFRSPKFNVSKIVPGGSNTISFVADESFEYSSYWPASGVKKADGFVNVE